MFVTIKFQARKIGAIGIRQTYIETLEVADGSEARAKLYDQYEHISILGTRESATNPEAQEISKMFDPSPRDTDY
jgi:hypothetical protein